VISTVIPLHNEERSIALLYEELQAALEPLGQDWEAVFVDDGSVDGSFAALTRLHAANENVRVVRLRRNFGKAAALAAGFSQARGEIVVTIDADLQDDPAEIPRLLVKLDEGFDLVSGWKTRRRDPLALDYGRYQLVEIRTGAEATVPAGDEHGLTLQQAEQVPVAQHPGRGIEPLRGLCDAHEGESNILMSRTALWACIGG